MVSQLGFVPVKVAASASKGIATDLGCDPITEDTITVLVTWQKQSDPSKVATGVYTASWTAPQVRASTMILVSLENCSKRICRSGD